MKLSTFFWDQVYMSAIYKKMTKISYGSILKSGREVVILSPYSDLTPEHCSNYKHCSGTGSASKPCLIFYILLSIKSTFAQVTTQKKTNIQTFTNVLNSSTLSLASSSSFSIASKACVLCLAKPGRWDAAVSSSVIAHSISITFLYSLVILRCWKTSTETQQCYDKSWWGGMVDYKRMNNQPPTP